MQIARHLPRFRKAYRSFEELEARENWTRSQIEAFQLERLNETWRHAIAHVAYYRQLQAQRQLPHRFQSLTEFAEIVPRLDKMYLRKNPHEFLSDQPQPGKWHRTSGSTSIPLQAFRSHVAHHEMLCTNYRYYRMWGHDIFDPMVFLWNFTRQKSGIRGRLMSYREIVEDKLRNRLRLSAHKLGRDDLAGYLKRIAEFRPSAIYSYSRAAYLLALEAKQQNFSCPSLKVINLTSEPATEHIVRTIEQAFGVPCIIQYGCVELGFVAGQWPDRTLRVREDIVYVESLPRKDGFYDVLLTCLNNPSFPLLRYDIGDVTDQPVALPPLGFAILNSISGRCGDMLYSPSGRCMHPTAADSVFEVEYCEFVRRYQIHQRSDYSLLVLIELNHPTRIPNLEQMAKHISQELDHCPTKVEIVEKIKQTEAGKHRNVISEIRTDPASY